MGISFDLTKIELIYFSSNKKVKNYSIELLDSTIVKPKEIV